MTRFEKIEKQMTTLKHAAAIAKNDEFAFMFLRKIKELALERGELSVADAGKDSTVHFGRSLAGAVYIFRNGSLVQYAPKN